eukprot:scaffold661664_cov47-Prasinocladus_malaysianus.AAC.1
MEALLRELEEDDSRLQERKAAKKAKKKGKLGKKKQVKQDSPACNLAPAGKKSRGGAFEEACDANAISPQTEANPTHAHCEE